MRVTLGGFAATAGFPAREVDDADLPPHQADELSRLVDRAAREGYPGADPALPDAMTYQVTVDRGSDSAVLEQSDGAMTPGFSALLDWLNANAG